MRVKTLATTLMALDAKVVRKTLTPRLGLAAQINNTTADNVPSEKD
jgi:hypothetical protein